MNNVLRTIRLAISRAIAPATIIEPETNATRMEEALHIRSIRNATYAEEVGHVDTLKGTISTEDISDLSSDYVKSGICSLGSWSALARAYNMFMKNPKDMALESILSEFHAWNAVNPQQMDEEAVLTTCAKLSQVQPAKGNKQTDEIIARVRKVSVEELRANREAEAKKLTAKREAMLEQFITIVWSHVYSEQKYSMPASKAEAKAISVIEWVANWNSSNPASQAAELLLIEGDIAQLRRMARQETAGNPTDFDEGMLTVDGCCRLSERAA